jgi:hypothetical protein
MYCMTMDSLIVYRGLKIGNECVGMFDARE